MFRFKYLICIVVWAATCRDGKMKWELRMMAANASVEISAPATHAPANETWMTLLQYIVPFLVMNEINF